ncbi:hypothetical protein K443DRAFT_683264 [Laccaria amethystina LaAM-08-1]|uniref:Uncharacterized protein n=1 Tax=Laccaria amethystina LaAM-08-1 TaxID=1095629 RepID=A0A0C9WJR5_9AGAR|nr:hypothetical protein K443DRAFT_683264 [Laccaria amethystina LaAM-08-1]
MNDDEHLLSRISTISALYNKLDHCLDSPGLELAQFLRELGFQASQAADYVDQRLGSSPLTPTTTQLPATAPAPLVTTPSAPAPIVATPAAPNTTQAPPIVRTGSTRGRKTSAQISQQRYDSIIAHIPDKIDPLQLKEYLSATHDQPYNNKTHAHLEDEAFSRLLRGYEPGTDEIWASTPFFILFSLFHSLTFRTISFTLYPSHYMQTFTYNQGQTITCR